MSASSRYTTKDCLDAKFETHITHPGVFFSLFLNELWIHKSECRIELRHKNILETKWLIDICREPIHIKHYTRTGHSVYKRGIGCLVKDKKDYCLYKDELMEIFQDDGLVYADGERETLSTPHGQTYCAFILAKKYLDEGVVFSKYDHFKKILPYETSSSEDKSNLKKSASLSITPPLQEETEAPASKEHSIPHSDSSPKLLEEENIPTF